MTSDRSAGSGRARRQPKVGFSVSLPIGAIDHDGIACDRPVAMTRAGVQDSALRREEAPALFWIPLEFFNWPKGERRLSGSFPSTVTHPLVEWQLAELGASLEHAIRCSTRKRLPRIPRSGSFYSGRELAHPRVLSVGTRRRR
jgi:hypothetical protein